MAKKTRTQTPNPPKTKLLLAIALLTAGVVAIIVLLAAGQEPAQAAGQSGSTAISSTSGAQSPSPERFPGISLPKPSEHSSLPPTGEFGEKTTESSEAQKRRHAREDRTKGSLSYKVSDQGKLVNGQQETMHLRIIDAVRVDDGSGDTDELPIHSYTIVVGSVTASKAFVSEHQTSVYSDFQITIDQVLQADPSQTLAAGDSITAERWGGSIHFPSGHIKHFLVKGEGFPGMGKKYVFFLSRPDPDLPEYLISTAYDISSGLVLPLDQGPSRKFENMKADEFLAFVQRQTAFRG